MKIKKIYSISNGKQIWRILISESDKVMLETRDTEKKEVYFSSYLLENGSPVFRDYQFEEKFWIGIERIYKDIIYLHKYPKPDMPGHREIIAFDAASQRVLWEKNDMAFSFVVDDKVYAVSEGMGGRYYSVLDYLTGEPLNRTEDESEVNRLYNTAQNSEDYSDYEFPEKLYGDEEESGKIRDIILSNLNGAEISGDIEFCRKNNLLFSSVHTKLKSGLMTNLFFINDYYSGDLIFKETANDKLELYAADTFFIYKNYLFLIKRKKKVNVYNING